MSEVVWQVHHHLPLAEGVDGTLHAAVEDVGRADVAALLQVAGCVSLAVPVPREAQWCQIRDYEWDAGGSTPNIVI